MLPTSRRHLAEHAYKRSNALDIQLQNSLRPGSFFRLISDIMVESSIWNDSQIIIAVPGSNARSHSVDGMRKTGQDFCRGALMA